MDAARLLDTAFAPARTSFRRLDGEEITVAEAAGRRLLFVRPEALRRLAREAFHDVSFFLRARQLQQWAAILDDSESSPNDRLVAAALLKNAAVAAEGLLPLCQDTGTATLVALKGEAVATGADDDAELAEGARQAYLESHLRFSQVAPLGMFHERNTGTNLPAQITIHAVPGDEYRFLFLAKGGGSSNKTSLFQQTKALLNEHALAAFLEEKVRALGVAACPPYHLGLVVGGTSPEMCLGLVKLATAGALDHLPTEPDGQGGPYRDLFWENHLRQIAAATGLGAQFGGKWLALDARVIRAARHGGSCPVALGVSCSAHRNALARISAEGVFLESLDRQPARYLPKALAVLDQAQSPRIDLDRPLEAVRQDLASLPAGTLVRLSGPLVVARDMAHARFRALLAEGRPLPDYLTRSALFYAGPAEAPPGHVIGSIGPTTAERMDPYLPDLMARGACLVTLGKAARASTVAAACRTHGGVYLGTIGGAAAWIAKEHVVADQVVDHADLGMEAVRRIEVRDLPAVVLIGAQGHDLYALHRAPARR